MNHNRDFNWLKIANNSNFTIEDLKNKTTNQIDDCSIAEQSENPKDSIQMIKWLRPQKDQMSETFASVSWDGSLYIYQTQRNGNTTGPKLTVKLVTSVSFNIPAICLEWSITNSDNESDGTFIYVGQIDGSVQCVHVASKQVVELYRDESSISALNQYYINEQVAQNSIIRGILIIGLEGKLTLLNADPNDKDFKKVIQSTTVNGCNYINACDYKNYFLLLAISKKKHVSENAAQCFENYLFYGNVGDFFNRISHFQSIEQRIQWPANSVTIMQDSNGPYKFCAATTDGKIDVIELKNTKSNSYGASRTQSVSASASDIKAEDVKQAFKAHYEINNNIPIFFQIPFLDCISFDKAKNILISGGGNSLFGFWDLEKKCPSKFYKLGASITCGKVSPCGQLTAYALGDNWQTGLHNLEQNVYQDRKIWVHINCQSDLFSSRNS